MKQLDMLAIANFAKGNVGWGISGDKLRKVYQFTAYQDGLNFTVKVASLAEKMNHHPDVLLGYNEVTVLLMTHDAGGITQLDLDLAQEIEKL